MGKKFQEIKDEILRRGREASACGGIRRAEDSKSLEELAQVIKDNFAWCIRNRVLDAKIISKYKGEFASVGIYANESRRDGYVVINSNVGCLAGNAIAILYGNATVKEMHGYAAVKEMHDYAVVKKMYDNTAVTEVSGYAAVKEMHDNAYLSVRARIECKINDRAIMRVRNGNKIYTNTKVVKP